MSLWPRIADLELTVEGCEYDTLEPGGPAGERAHDTRLVQLAGGGEVGLSEDITLFIGDPPDLALAGEWTLASFCDHLATLDQWPGEPPEWDMARRWRTWGYEAAALDLALRQAGRPLHAALGLEPRPITYVNSLGLGEPASADTVLRRLDTYPDLRFKLDAAADWDDAIVAALVATGAVHTIDFKGRYHLDVDDWDALRAMYERVIAAFPDALLEDPHEELMELIPAERLSFDAPVHLVSDLEALGARTFNIKPTRIGSVRELLAIYVECDARGYAMYGGGMGELGVARDQIQLLASLFSPDAPNDIAPPGFNALEPAAGLETSPLDPAPAPTGFRRS